MSSTPSSLPLAEHLKNGGAGNTFLLLAPHLQDALVARGEALPHADQPAWLDGVARMDLNDLLALAESTPPRQHTVRKGQTLSGIARDHHVELQALLAANPQITNPDLIHPGQQVQIPPPRPN